MRPLYHPALNEITVQGILYALSDPVRVRIYVELAQADCAMNCDIMRVCSASRRSSGVPEAASIAVVCGCCTGGAVAGADAATNSASASIVDRSSKNRRIASLSPNSFSTSAMASTITSESAPISRNGRWMLISSSGHCRSCAM